MSRFVIISGCSGGGKSSLLDELRRQGHACIDEPGRRIVRAELAAGGSALPWTDARAFVRKAIDLALADLARAETHSGWVFFDRSLVDAASALAHLTGDRAHLLLAGTRRYHRKVFLTPPWPEIYRRDAERQHGFDEARAEYDRLCRDYADLGYEPVCLPQTPVEHRVRSLLAGLGTAPGASPGERSFTGD
jgi:predicted ATPase